MANGCRGCKPKHGKRQEEKARQSVFKEKIACLHARIWFVEQPDAAQTQQDAAQMLTWHILHAASLLYRWWSRALRLCPGKHFELGSITGTPSSSTTCDMSSRWLHLLIGCVSSASTSHCIISCRTQWVCRINHGHTAQNRDSLRDESRFGSWYGLQ